MILPVRRGDILLRTGLVSGIDVLSRILNEPYNHAGIALDKQRLHHIESNWYETITIEDFFAKKNAARGAIVRFVGPYSSEIADRAAQIAESRTYEKIPGNPFSTSRDTRTVNCNEFIYLLFKRAIAETYMIMGSTMPLVAAMLKEVYGDNAGILPREVGWSPEAGGVRSWMSPLVASVAESVGQSQVTSPNVKVQFEGEFKEVHYDDYDPRYPSLLKYIFKDADLITVAFLEAYTPNSFLNSPFFEIVDKFDVR